MLSCGASVVAWTRTFLRYSSHSIEAGVVLSRTTLPSFTAEFWLNLQLSNDLGKVRIEEQKQIVREVHAYAS